MYVPFEPRFAAGDHVFVERSPQIATAVDRMSYEGYSKHLLCRTERYLISSMEPEYAEVGQNDIENTVLITRLNGVVREEGIK